MIKKENITINEMIETIINAVSLDDFAKYHNGNLVETFSSDDKSTDIEEYKSTNLYKTFAESDNPSFKSIFLQNCECI